MLLVSFVGFGFSVLSQKIGQEERLRNDLSCVEWDAKPCSVQSDVQTLTNLNGPCLTIPFIHYWAGSPAVSSTGTCAPGLQQYKTQHSACSPTCTKPPSRIYWLSVDTARNENFYCATHMWCVAPPRFVNYAIRFVVSLAKQHIWIRRRRRENVLAQAKSLFAIISITAVRHAI